tara:strand:+ start:693 stop:2489 length:1797 start_codon:yes stop_codon:yes gene_type:complete
MIIELSKDKSLLNVLSKVELDKETKKLVNNSASTSVIKMSLERNINSSNIIQYRKYIAKADEDLSVEQAKDKAEEEAEKDRRRSEEISNITDKENEANRTAAEFGNLNLEQDASKKAFKELSIYNSAIDALESLSTSVKIVEPTGKSKVSLTVVGGRKDYQYFANTPAKSEQILDVFQSLENNPSFLLDNYRDSLNNGVFLGQNFANNDDGSVNNTENEDKDINVTDLQSRLNALRTKEFTVEDSKEKVSFVRVIQLQHIQLYNREPKNTINRPRRKAELQGMQRFARGSSPKVHRAYEKQLKSLKAATANVSKLQVTLTLLEEKEDELMEIINDSKKIVARKIAKLVTSLSTIMNRREFKHNESQKVISAKAYNKLPLKEQKDYSPTLTIETIKEKTSSIADLRENPDKYLDEAKEELEEELHEEQAKIDSIIANLKVFNTIKPHLKGLTRIINMFKENEPIDAIKVKITSAAGLLIDIKRATKKMAALSDNAEKSIDEAFVDLLSDKDVTLTIEGDSLTWGGLPTIEEDKFTNMKQLTETIEVASEKLQSLVNEINHMVEGAIDRGTKQKTPKAVEPAEPFISAEELKEKEEGNKE